ncbi:MAG: tRNA 4-thiouridine(8) synthase ThiI [Candidatus Aureabacteria bacterium]|nr:tRNA 4-thiouridine(8) synthase ThiI [Candidatus Auribacterota bacterium]
MSETLYLLSYGELALKGRNRPFFVKRLIKNIIEKIKNLGHYEIHSIDGRLLLNTTAGPHEVYPVLSKIFGLAGFSLVVKCGLNYEEVREKTLQFVSSCLSQKPEISTFKIAARRSNKQFEKNSTELNSELGLEVLKAFPQLKVDVKTPHLAVHVEIRDQEAFIHSAFEKGGGGLPVGISGKGLLLLSGGIDSPVAGWMLLKRGMQVTPLHFCSPPYTSPRARQKVIDLARVLASYGGEKYLHLLQFTPVQLKIKDTRHQDLMTLLLRRAMMDAAMQLSQKLNQNTVITGENLGQVASQTIESMTATAHQYPLQVIRPLIGFDKMEIIEKAKQIQTYEISIQPYEDCCTLFLPEHPCTKPHVNDLLQEYNTLELDQLVSESVINVEVVSLL